jgi:rhamnulokinase
MRERRAGYLAFDLGASSGRAMLGWLEGPVLHMAEVHRFETSLIERDGHLFWDVEALEQEIWTGLQQALAQMPALRAVSVDSWAVDYVLLNREGRPLRPPYSYRDTRTRPMMARAFARVAPAELYARTGIQLIPINTLYQLLADLEEDPAVLRRAERLLLIADYFNHRLGGQPVVEVSMASTTQLMNVHTRQWDAELLRAFGLDFPCWPEIVPSGQVIGQVRGHPSVAVIASCSHDTACAVAAVPARPGTRWAYISLGTWALLGVERTTPILTDAAREAGFTHEAGLDGTIRFLKNLTGLWVLQECLRAWRQEGPVSWETLEAEARAAPADRCYLDLDDPYFFEPGQMPERIVAYCRRHGLPVPEGRGQMVRAILESLARNFQRALRQLEALIEAPVDTLHIVGGGARNRLLCQLTADTCEVRVVAGPAEATAMGNLLIQARTLGDLPEGYTLRDVVARSETCWIYEPHQKPIPQPATER